MNEYPDIPKSGLLDPNLDSDNNQSDLYSTESTTPNMGQVNSKDIGALPYAGRLGGEMVRRMIKEQEEKLAEEYNNNQLK